MSRPAQLEPAWLIGLLVQWGRRDLHADHGLGWYAECPMLRDGVRGQARSYEPMGYSGTDYRELETALRGLTEKRLLAVMRYCKPWKVQAIDAEHPLDTDTWMYHLKNGLAALVEAMEPSVQMREATK